MSFQMGDDGASHEVCALDVCVDDFIPVFVCRVGQPRLGGIDAGAVEQMIYAAKVTDNGASHFRRA